MEVLGGTSPDDGRQGGAAAEVDLDEGQQDEVGQHEVAAAGAPGRVLPAMVDGPALAVAGFTIGVAGLITGYPGPIAMVSSAAFSVQNQVTRYSVALGVSGVLALLLSALGLRRSAAGAPGWSRALAGAGCLIGVLVLAIAVYLVWRSTGLDPSQGP